MDIVNAEDLSPTSIIDSDHKTIIEYANDAVSGAGDDPVEKAVRLYYAVRDDIWYDPYYPFYLPGHYRASNVLKSGRGFCISKISLLCAVGRACGIPSRAGFATVRNHLATRRLLEYLGSDLFVYHGFTEFFLEDKWVKATPAFNIELCEKHKVIPLEFNGREDSIFHEYNSEKEQFMEYIEYHGSYADIPVETILAEWRKAYGRERVNQWISMLETAGEMPGSDAEVGDS
ncbi:MAG: transglutaminase domain-containing protein [Deltaproteobacteria bacterium]|nr:transglutaminase domain-containing protein [Deltaproteobacteria bacterium]MBW2192359.1 transglutaminase domain-containing protein [Deltaproteobacteria bacterium]